MHRFISLSLCLGCILAVVPSRLWADCSTGTYVVPVEPGRDSQPIAKSQLLTAASSGCQIVGYSQPQVGMVLESADSFSYKPSTQFWTLGTDSFTVHLAPSGRGTQDSVRARTVFLVSALGPAENLAERFEGALGSSWSSQGIPGQIQLFTDNALSGQQSLRIEQSAVVGSWIKAHLTGRSGLVGGGQQGSGAEATFRPPGSGGPGNFGEAYEVAFFSAGVPTAPDYRLWLRDGGASPEIRAEIPGVPGGGFTPWIPISRSVHHFQITRWKENAYGSRAGGSFLWLDGALVAELAAEAPQGLDPQFQVGSLDAHALSEVTPEIALDLDDVYVYATRLDRGASLCLAADGFEGGQIGSAWVVPAGVSATEAAALDGSSGLEVDVEETTHLMEIATPTPSRRYGARFRLDPNTVDLSASGQVLLFRALAANGLTAVKLVLEPASSGYQLRALSQDDSGVFRAISHPLSDGPHTLSVDWQRATGEQAPIGSLRLWIDDTLAGEMTGLASAGQEIAGAYLGALLVEGTGSGTVYLDGFEAWQGVP